MGYAFVEGELEHLQVDHHEADIEGRRLEEDADIMVLRETLLPEPVEPATRRWGILVSSATKGSPAIVFPRERVSMFFEPAKASDSMISLR